MCVSRLYRVLSCERDSEATVVDADGRRARVSLLALDGPRPLPDEWLVVHSGYAVDRMPDDDARLIVAELREGADGQFGGGS